MILYQAGRKERRDPLSKRLPSRFFNAGGKVFSAACRSMISTAVSRAYRRETVKSLQLYGELHRYIPVLAKFNGYRVGEIDVRHHPRKYGHSKYGVKTLHLRVSRPADRDTSHPLYIEGRFTFSATVGLTFCFIGGLVDLYIVKLWVFSRASVISEGASRFCSVVYFCFFSESSSFQPVCWLSS